MLSRAIAAHQAGNIPQAEFLYKLVLQADKKQFDALHMLAIIEGQRGNFVAALSRIKEALRIRPKSVEALINLGRIEAEIDHHANAVVAYERALALDPSAALAHSNLGIVLRTQGRLDAALGHCDAALRIAPDFAEAWNNRGNVLFDLKQFPNALESYDRAVRLQPKLAEAHLGRGNVFIQLRRFGEALAAYDHALAVRPDSAEAHCGRGNALRQLMHVEDSLAAYERALVLKSDYAECQLARGEMLLLLGRHDAARDAFARGFAIKPDQPYAEGAVLAAKLQSCDWNDLDTLRAHLIAGVKQGLPRVDPLRMLYVLDSPADQLKCAGIWVLDRYPPSPQPLWRGERYRHDRIRVAYLSADFRHHAVAYLTAGMFEAHDRSRFETTAVSIGPETNDDMRTRLRSAFDRFLDVRTRSDQEVAELLRALEIDIAVDLSGFTENSRPHIMAQRPAPVQASYLGYSATMGASYIDYIIADQTIIPPEHAAFFTEKIVRLPDTYMANDAGRRISERTPSRAECGLPDGAFVFCCFNHAYKISPEIFRIWMRLLKSTQDSVLWLQRCPADRASQSATRGRTVRRRITAADLCAAYARDGRPSGAAAASRFVPRHAAVQRPHHIRGRALGWRSGGDLLRLGFCRASGNTRSASGGRP